MGLHHPPLISRRDAIARPRSFPAVLSLLSRACLLSSIRIFGSPNSPSPPRKKGRKEETQPVPRELAASHRPRPFCRRQRSRPFLYPRSDSRVRRSFPRSPSPRSQISPFVCGFFLFFSFLSFPSFLFLFFFASTPILSFAFAALLVAGEASRRDLFLQKKCMLSFPLLMRSCSHDRFSFLTVLDADPPHVFFSFRFSHISGLRRRIEFGKKNGIKIAVVVCLLLGLRIKLMVGFPFFLFCLFVCERLLFSFSIINPIDWHNPNHLSCIKKSVQGQIQGCSLAPETGVSFPGISLIQIDWLSYAIIFLCQLSQSTSICAPFYQSET